MYGILAGSLEAFSLTIAIIVILSMTISFGILFLLITIYRRRLLLLGALDESIQNALEVGFEKAHQKSLEKNEDISFQDYITAKRKKEKIVHIILEVVYGIAICFVCTLIIITSVFRSSNQQLFIGKTTYMTIQTGSMEFKNKDHPYYASLPDDQIKQYSLIGIKKVTEEDLKLYDIIAFKEKDTIYVHRIVSITEIDGKKYFTTQGDANTGSLPLEISFDFEKIIGVYSGYQSLGLGVFMYYFQSYIGTISLFFTFLLFMAMDILDEVLTHSYRKRQDELIQQILVEEKV